MDCPLVCGVCCENLYFWDNLMISWHTKSFMFSQRCKFLTNINLCSIYKNRPKVCKDWICGVKKLKSALSQGD